jgi:hypothetical protein
MRWTEHVALMGAMMPEQLSRHSGGLLLNDRVSIPSRGKIFPLSATSRLPFSPPSFLSNGYRVRLANGKGGHLVKLTIQLHLAPRTRMVELYLQSPIGLRGILFKVITTVDALKSPGGINKHKDNFTFYFTYGTKCGQVVGG